jgi:signal transduction histidine kinase
LLRNCRIDAELELEQAVRMRDDFMSIVAHEVRTPLNGLILETQLRKMHLARDNACGVHPGQNARHGRSR